MNSLWMLANAAIAMGPTGLEVQNRAFWVETAICTVVQRATIEPGRPIQLGTPIDLLPSLPAVCTSNATGQTPVAAGVRSLTVAGFRVTGVSHQVTVLPTPLQTVEPRAELLISAIFSLERPPASLPSSHNR